MVMILVRDKICDNIYCPTNGSRNLNYPDTVSYQNIYRRGGRLGQEERGEIYGRGTE